MAGFSIRNPYFIIVCCLIIAIVGTVTLVRMPVDLFPADQYPRGGGGDILFRHAAATD